MMFEFSTWNVSTTKLFNLPEGLISFTELIEAFVSRIYITVIINEVYVRILYVLRKKYDVMLEKIEDGKNGGGTRI